MGIEPLFQHFDVADLVFKFMGCHPATMLPAGFVIVISLFRGIDRTRFYWLAWPLAPSGEIVSWGIVVVLFVLGLTLAFVYTNGAIADD